MEPVADIKNMEAVIRWKALPGANTYHVYRKRGRRPKGTEIASVTGRSYTDRYKRSYGERKDIMFFGMYIDPSDNDLEYNVRAESVKRNGSREKRSIGLMTADYNLELEPPVKVVFVDLFYSERVLDKGMRKSRDVTENRLGYTLLDYQDALDAMYEKWLGSDAMRLYEYRTREAAVATHANLPHMTVDNLHFTKYAYALYGNSIAQFLVEEVL